MKRIYLFSGGGFVTASSPTEFLTKMQQHSLFDDCEGDAFMLAVALRCNLDSGAVIRHHDAAEFLHDLIAHEYVIAINPN